MSTNLGARLKRLRQVLQEDWNGVADRLGLSVSMVHQVNSGKRSLSDVAEHRLRVEEQRVGLDSAPGVQESAAVHTPPSDPDNPFMFFETSHLLSAARKIGRSNPSPALLRHMDSILKEVDRQLIEKKSLQ